MSKALHSSPRCLSTPHQCRPRANAAGPQNLPPVPASKVPGSLFGNLTGNRATSISISSSSSPPRIQAAAVDVPVVEAPSSSSKPEPSYVSSSDKYAICEIGGTQLILEEGRWYTCNRLEADPGSKIQLGRVLAIKSEGKLHVGKPYLENVTVEAEIVEDLKGPKLIVYKMKPKKHYQRKTGHRQPLTKFVITKISS